MEQQEKPRLSYAEFIATQQAHERPGTVAWLIYRYINEMNSQERTRLGITHEYALKALARRPIGKKMAAKLTKADIIEHCNQRRLKVGAATVGQDITYLTGPLKYAGSAWDDCAEINAGAIEAAKPFLTKQGIIGKSSPRSRRPTVDELDDLLDFFTEQQKTEHCKTDMVRVTIWQVASSRRISETCRLLWCDWARATHTILVRKMKDPKNKNKRKVVALPDAAQAMLEELWAALPPELQEIALTVDKNDPRQPRIFPYRSATCSARYTAAKKVLAERHPGMFLDLRLHDSRRECYTRLVEDEGYSLEEAILVTGHETIAIPQKTYLAQNPERFHLGPRAKRLQGDGRTGMIGRLQDHPDVQALFK